MNILGISAYYHDSAACLLKNGEIIAAAQEERFTRKKHDSNFPTHAINYCLKEAQIVASEIDNVVFYEKHFFNTKTCSPNLWFIQQSFHLKYRKVGQ